MSKIDHYMVDYLAEDGSVAFATEREITKLTAAKAIASKVSLQHDTGAYVVAYVRATSDPASAVTYEAVGHISFFDGKQSSTDGVVI